MNKLHRTLVIGVGSIGERHLRCFQGTGRAEIMLCEPNEKLRADVAKRYGVTKAYGSFDEAVAAAAPGGALGGIDTAVICTPAPFHVPMATRLAEAGVHLLIEKPLSTSMDGVEHMRQTIAKHGVKAMMGYTWRNHPLLAEMKRMLDTGMFGKPKHMVIFTGQNFPHWRPAYRQIYYAKHETGGGAIQDALTHMLNAGEWLCGPITRLTADAAHQVLEGTTVEDTVNLIARQGEGVLASYSLNQFQMGNRTLFSIKCDKATVEMDLDNALLRWTFEPDGVWQEKKLETKMERDTLYIAQANRFMDFLDGKAEALCTLDEGIQTLKVNLAALEAARAGTWRTIS